MVAYPAGPPVERTAKAFADGDSATWDSFALGALEEDRIEEQRDFEEAQALATFQVFASSHEDASFDLPTDPKSLGVQEQCRLGRGLNEIHKAMRREQLSFRDARLAMVARAMEAIGADATGMPKDPKAFTLERSTPRRSCSPRRSLKTPREETILADFLQKRSRLLRVWRPRWTVLSSRRLCTYKSQEDAARPHLATEVVNLEEIVEVRRRGQDWVVVHLRPSVRRGSIGGGHIGLSTDSQARAVLGQAEAQRRSFVLRLGGPEKAERWHAQLILHSQKAQRYARGEDLPGVKSPQAQRNTPGKDAPGVKSPEAGFD